MGLNSKSKGPLKRYYAVLGVGHSASQKEIQQAFRKLARKFHPDVSSDPDAVEKFKELVEAYRTLKAPDSRDDYDAKIISQFCRSYLIDPRDLRVGPRVRKPLINRLFKK
jgi:curved DNA-binding protein CbpA